MLRQIFNLYLLNYLQPFPMGKALALLLLLSINPVVSLQLFSHISFPINNDLDAIIKFNHFLTNLSFNTYHKV